MKWKMKVYLPDRFKTGRRWIVQSSLPKKSASVCVFTCSYGRRQGLRPKAKLSDDEMKVNLWDFQRRVARGGKLYSIGR